MQGEDRFLIHVVWRVVREAGLETAREVPLQGRSASWLELTHKDTTVAFLFIEDATRFSAPLRSVGDSSGIRELVLSCANLSRLSSFMREGARRRLAVLRLLLRMEGVECLEEGCRE